MEEFGCRISIIRITERPGNGKQHPPFDLTFPVHARVPLKPTHPERSTEAITIHRYPLILSFPYPTRSTISRWSGGINFPLVFWRFCVSAC